jgi:ABC-2 type transport system ATP-binding protein
VPAAVRTEKLTKRFGKILAVDEISMTVEAGEIYGLLGPNGAGKTTLVRMLCGLLLPTSGTAFVLGARMPCPSIKARIGYMPQESALYHDLTVHENLQLFGAIYDIPDRTFNASEEELLDFIQLRDRRDELVGNLSGGMRHRLSLACAMIHRPELLFLDEPTVGIDPQLRAAFWSFFSSLRQRGVTILMTTHYMDEASRCTRIGLMRQGRLISQGTPDAVMSEAGADSIEQAFLKLATERGANP